MGTIKKTSAEVYEVWADGEFACIAIQCHNFSENRNAGRIMIHSTYGAWGYCWGSTGPLFKEFLCKLDCAYTAVKFGAKDVFDETATLEAMIADLRENLEIEKFPYSTEFYEAIGFIQDRIKNPEGSFETWFYNSSDDYIIYNHFGYGMDLPMRHNPCPQFKGFWDQLWPLFIKQIKDELSVVHVYPIDYQKKN